MRELPGFVGNIPEEPVASQTGWSLAPCRRRQAPYNGESVRAYLRAIRDGLWAHD